MNTSWTEISLEEEFSGQDVTLVKIGGHRSRIVNDLEQQGIINTSYHRNQKK